MKTRTNQPVEGDELEGLKVTGDLEVTGDAKLFENIVDKDGNKRFVEGNLTLDTISGVSFTYGKWSLSGSHLMIVVVGRIEQGTYPSPQQIFSSNFPTFIMNKIIPMSSQVVSITDGFLYISPSNVIPFTSRLIKPGLSGLRADIIGLTNVAQAGNFRIQYDLLIDAE